MTKPKNSDLVGTIVDLLTPLDSEDRQKVIQASLLLLGETIIQNKSNNLNKVHTEELPSSDILSKQATIWMKQNNITEEELQQVFHISDGKADIIASEIPGNDTKTKTLNAYILEGIGRMLVSGDSLFDDKSARDLCKSSGCYNNANHALYLKAKGNRLTGSKDGGWKLTAPGLKHGADLIKDITK